MYKRILVPLDGSPQGEAALSLVEELLDPYGEIVLMRIGQLPRDVLMEEGRVFFLDEQASWLESDLNQYLSDVALPLRMKDHKVQTVVRFGLPERQIIWYAEENDIDLIVMPAQVRSGLSRFFSSDVSEKVLKDSPVPVLLVKIPEREVVSKAA